MRGEVSTSLTCLCTVNRVNRIQYSSTTTQHSIVQAGKSARNIPYLTSQCCCFCFASPQTKWEDVVVLSTLTDCWLYYKDRRIWQPQETRPNKYWSYENGLQYMTLCQSKQREHLIWFLSTDEKSRRLIWSTTDYIHFHRWWNDNGSFLLTDCVGRTKI